MFVCCLASMVASMWHTLWVQNYSWNTLHSELYIVLFSLSENKIRPCQGLCVRSQDSGQPKPGSSTPGSQPGCEGPQLGKFARSLVGQRTAGQACGQCVGVPPCWQPHSPVDVVRAVRTLCPGCLIWKTDLERKDERLLSDLSCS